jgi:hypothetical protein
MFSGEISAFDGLLICSMRSYVDYNRFLRSPQKGASNMSDSKERVFAVLGAGRQGTAAAYDLAKFGNAKIDAR